MSLGSGILRHSLDALETLQDPRRMWYSDILRLLVDFPLALADCPYLSLWSFHHLASRSLALTALPITEYNVHCQNYLSAGSRMG